MKDKTVICDLDSTLFDIDHRLHFLEEKQWDEFFAACVDDTPNDWCVELIRAMQTAGYPIIFVSGRNEVVRAETMSQLQALGFGSHKLFMRPRDDRRGDVDFKRKLLQTELASTDILFVIEDRQRVCEMWREHGIIVLQCASGDF